MTRVQSSQGSAQHYGPREANTGLPDSVSTFGVTKEVEIFFDFEQTNAGLPTENADVDAAVKLIPANSFIKAAWLEVDTAFTSGGAATLELGFQQADGTVIDADGIDTIAVAALTAGSWTVNDGALVGTAIGANAAQISIDDATAVFTAGSGRLIVEYFLPFSG